MESSSTIRAGYTAGGTLKLRLGVAGTVGALFWGPADLAFTKKTSNTVISDKTKTNGGTNQYKISNVGDVIWIQRGCNMMYRNQSFAVCL